MEIKISISKKNKEKTLRLISELVDVEDDRSAQERVLTAPTGRATIPKIYSKGNSNVHERYDNATSHKPRLLRIGNKEYYIRNWRDVLTGTVEYLIDSKKLSVRDCPVPATDRVPYKRNLVNTRPVHNDESQFRLPKQVRNFYVETHWSASRTCLLSERLLEKFGGKEALEVSNKTHGTLYTSAS